MILLYATYKKLRRLNRKIDKQIFKTTFHAGKKGKHPKWMHFEDVLQEEAVSEDTAERVRNKLNSTFLKMLNKFSKFTLTLTRYGIGDLYEYLESTRKMPIVRYEALNVDTGEWLEHPNFTKEMLEEMRRRDITSFETEMNNNPIPSTGVYFDRSDWKSVDILPYDFYNQAQYYITIDPARGMSQEADRTAILVHGLMHGKDYIVDGQIDRIDDEKILSFVISYIQKYKRINYVIGEKIMAQNSWLMSKLENIPYFIPFTQTSVNAKYSRIDALKPLFKRGLIVIYAHVEFYDILYNEYLQYNSKPSTPTRKDDGLDSLSMGIQTFGQYLSSSDSLNEEDSPMMAIA